MSGTTKINKYLNLFKNRNFLMYIIGQIVSRFCDSCFKISLIWYLTNRPNAFDTIAVTLLVAYFPQLLVGILGGYLVDRIDRRIAMILSDGISAVILLGFYFIAKTDMLSIPVILTVRFFLSLMDTIYSPAAMAYIPRIVEKSALVSANSLFTIIGEATAIASTAVTGIIMNFVTFEIIVFINCIAYAFAALMIFLIPVDGKAETCEKADKFNFKAVTSGFRYAFKDTFVWQFILVIFLTNITSNVFYSLTSLYTVTVLHAESDIYGIIQTVISIGMFISTALIGVVHIKKVGLLLTSGFLMSGVVMILLGFTNNTLIAILLYFFFSFGDALGIPSFTYLQLHVPENIKGRVFAAFDTLVLIAAPISSLLISTVAGTLGVPSTYILNGIVLVFVFFIALFMRGIKDAVLLEENAVCERKAEGLNLAASHSAVKYYND